jgi:hypothetical protein
MNSKHFSLQHLRQSVDPPKSDPIETVFRQPIKDFKLPQKVPIISDFVSDFVKSSGRNSSSNRMRIDTKNIVLPSSLELVKQIAEN